MPNSDLAPLTLAGALTLRTAEETLATLRTALAGHGSLSIDCTGAEEADLSLVQLLLAARARACADGGELMLAAPPQGALLRTLIAAGFRPYGNAEDGFWFEGETA